MTDHPIHEVADALRAADEAGSAVGRALAYDKLTYSKILAASDTIRSQEAEIARLRELEALFAALTSNPCWELSWGEPDEEEGSPLAWRVHARSGNRSDREWALIGVGTTPDAAIRAALKGTTHD